MRGYREDMYGGGDFNETRGRNLCSICKEPVIRLAGIKDEGSRSIHRTCLFS
jgi:hypothetical protein